MFYNVDDIVKDVCIAIDQNSTSERLIESEDIDTLSLNEIVRSKIEDAARGVEKSAPVYLLETGTAFGDSINWKSTKGVGMGYTLLPDNFMRLISFQMSDWQTAVYNAISQDDPLYGLQSSRYPGIRGCPQKPVCAIVPAPVGLVLEFYSCTQGETVHVVKAQYLPEPVIGEDGYIDICEKCYRAVVYNCAGLVCSAYGSKEQAELMFKLSSDLLV